MPFPTNPIYKLYKNSFNNSDDGVLLSKDGKTYAIPLDEANTDYQEYLAWLAEGNTAEAAD